MARLVVVSNRVAVPDRSTRAGGLEVAIKEALKRHQGLWFGWSGRATDSAPGPAKTVERDNITYVTVDVARSDYREFYSGVANRVLWPILHYRLDLAEFSRRDLGGYFRVNEHFAEGLHKVLRPDDIVWVHDYHFIPLGRELRKRGHRNRIGFFLHVPFPPPEIITALPNHQNVVPALTEYDLIGFQTGKDAANFGQYLTRECGLHSRDFKFSVDGRIVKVEAHPVGIDVDNFERLARRARRVEFVREVFDSLSGRALLIGVDRLDYSKGITQRMDAFERFLAANADWRGKITYLQIAPKSRTEIPEYADMQALVNTTAGRINGTYGEAAWTPIRYINRAHSRAALAGLYRGARAALVTPLRDGMNLVAKEYVAAQDAEDPGVLILSQFAGAAEELTAAMIVNPYDPDGVGSAIARALKMPLDERQGRHAAMMEKLKENDIHHWADRFLASLVRENQPAYWSDGVASPMSEEMARDVARLA